MERRVGVTLGELIDDLRPRQSPKPPKRQRLPGIKASRLDGFNNEDIEITRTLFTRVGSLDRRSIKSPLL